MALEKATITPEGGTAIKVHFNPTNYSLERGNQIAEIGVPGLSAPIIQYVRGNARNLSMELLCDTYEDRKDVRIAYTDPIYKLLEIDGTTHAPPICTFEWKDFKFRCVLTRVDGRFTLFLEDGTPVRASLTISFKEFIPVDALVRRTPTESSNHTKTYTVKLGDTLSGIASTEYGDPIKWRPIAIANQISNPRKLKPGQVLVIPPLE